VGWRQDDFEMWQLASAFEGRLILQNPSLKFTSFYTQVFIVKFRNLLKPFTHKVVYHVTPISGVSRIQTGIEPGYNIWAQYGQGFYTFAKRRDAHKWRLLRPTLLEISEEHIILEFRIPRHFWKQLNRQKVPATYNWRIPPDWLQRFDILESNWATTPETATLSSAKQYKFNPHTYWILDAALIR
jgi:hypothetical protein